MKRYGLVLVTSLTGALLTVGCSSGSRGPAVPSLGSSTPRGTSSPTGSPRDRALAYSQCMRTHGIKDFPDPSSDGDIRLEAHPGSDLMPDSPRFKSAQQACKALEPTGSPQDQAKQHATALKYSKCMRDHGINDFPDPNPQGGIQISMSPGSDLDPNSPRFKAADKACAQFRGGKGGPGAGSNVGGKS
jgi:hypothetical protein